MSGARLSAVEQGGLEILRIEAGDLPAAHAALGARLRGAIAAVVERRLAATEPAELAAQLQAIRQSRAHLEHKGAVATPALSRALRAYLDCLAAWAEGAELAALSGRLGIGCDAGELALWLQDDNTGCQTGMARAADGSVLLWHTEEDTIGYFDRARLVEIHVGGARLCAFLYPYLMPGPAFGWHARGLVAYDTLNVRRSPGGTPTSTLSWLLWSAQGELAPLPAALALAPFLDGGAFSVVTRGDGRVEAQVVEVGGALAVASTLAHAPGARRLQVNMLSNHAGALAALESLGEAERAPYRERLARTARMLDACRVPDEGALEGMLAAREAGEGACANPACPTLDERALEGMLASREGGEWAFANADVVATLIARVARDRSTLRVGIGPASEQRATASFVSP